MIAASFCGDEIKVTVPEAVATEWATSEQVGMDRVQPISDGLALSILIEKDFRCLAPRPGEDESDSFANPAAAETCTPN
ncbi:MAG TPA: hypothetical protein VEN79_09330 [Terriglobia bacterium]|nr:hypothetical protein [Terriglobia bacterium]